MMIVSGLTACNNPVSAERAGKTIDQVPEDFSTSVSNAAERTDQAITKQANTADQVMDDTTITTKVRAALLNEPDMPSFKISVETDNGVVMLSGSADSQAKINKAIQLAGAINGVQSVISTLVMLN